MAQQQEPGTDEAKAICDAAVDVTGRIQTWLLRETTDRVLRQEKPLLERELRTSRRLVRRLTRAVTGRPAVGVFGPSQSGKSYLVSALAGDGESLKAIFGPNQRYEFLTTINPAGGKEATGLVTRFTVSPADPSPEGYPVALKLLSEADIVRIIANAYCLDGEEESHVVLTREAVEAHLVSLEGRALSGMRCVDEDTPWEIQEYVCEHFGRFDHIRALEPFWDRIAELICRLGVEGRCEVYALLWGQQNALSELARKLCATLEALRGSETAYAAIDALLPREDGILNVEALASLWDENSSRRVRVSANNIEIELSTGVLGAITAELSIVVGSAGWPFLRSADVLDFPGYRSRTPQNLTRYLREAPALACKELFLRGKVDFLFQRYSANFQLSALLLCLRDSNLEVASLPAVIEKWIAATHGATPEERKSQQTRLFVVLTMFDRHLVDNAGEEDDDPGGRFKTRLEASLLHPFGKLDDSWPRAWTPGVPFQNCFWSRNPNVKAEHVIQYSGRSEEHVLPERTERLVRLRSGFLANAGVRTHFADPARAWDEVMRLNDGGVGYLARSIADVSRTDVVQRQSCMRLARVCKGISARLREFYETSDLDAQRQRVNERTDQMLGELDRCFAANTFGSLVWNLCVDGSDLNDALYEAMTRGRAEATVGEVASKPGVFSVRRILRQQRGVGSGSEAPPITKARQEWPELLASRAVREWARQVRERASSTPLMASLGVTAEGFGEIAAEILKMAHRSGLEKNLAARIRSTAFMESPDRAVAKASVIAERTINRCVGSLGFDGTATEQRPVVQSSSGERVVFEERPVEVSADAIGAEAANYWEEYGLDWTRALEQIVADNIGRFLDDFAMEQNAILGGFIADLDAVAQAAAARAS